MEFEKKGLGNSEKVMEFVSSFSRVVLWFVSPMGRRNKNVSGSIGSVQISAKFGNAVPVHIIGLYTNHRVISWNWPRTDVVGPYRIAAVLTSYILQLHCTRFYRFVSWSGRFWTRSGRTLNSIGSYRKSTGPYSELFWFISWISSARAGKNRVTNRTWYEPIIRASSVHIRVVSPQTDTYLYGTGCM
jgi:hypothetical protein